MKGIYWLVIIALLLAFGLIVVNKYYETNDKKEAFNVSISAEYNRKLVKTGIVIDGQTINTSTSYELVKINEGMIKIKNINIEDQIFYEDEIEINLTGNMRIDIVLDKPELPTIKVNDGETLLLVLESKNFKEVDFCLRGSYNYIFLDAPEFNEIKKLKGFENYDACFNGDFSLNGNKQEIEITYTEFSNTGKGEYINISLIDKANNKITQTIK